MSTSDSTTQIIHNYPDNSNNIQHTESDIKHKNPNKSTDSYTQKLISNDNMLLFITLTQRCQLNCRYCGNGTNKDIEELAVHVPEINYDINLIKKFQKVKKLIVCFYGGEPLFRINIIEKIIPMLPNALFCLQTNGLFLRMLKPEIIKKFDTILVSLDGDEYTTDYNRGKGIYKKIIKNVKFIREKLNFKGDLIARMTCSGICDIYKSVVHLLSLKLFDHVHWQLDVEWDSDMDGRYNTYLSKTFIEWRDNIYNKGISKLMELFMEKLREGIVLGIVPFLGLLKYFIKGEKIKRILCGSGSDAFNITTGGFVNCCPIAPEFDPVADIRNDNFNHLDLYDSELISGDCLKCEILDKCGGRCLYANKDGWWGENGHKEVCQTIKYLVNEIEKYVPEIKEIINKNEKLKDYIFYPKYNNSCEIIP